MLNILTKTPHRNHLESYLSGYLPKLSGSILDIGSKNRRYGHLMNQKPIAIDIVANKDKDVQAGDINNLKFESGSFENISCLEVLEYVSTPERAIREMFRVLSVGGTLILSVPFMYKFHDDELRYTEQYVKKLFINFRDIKIFTIGNAYTIILDIVYGKIKEISFLPLRYFFMLLYLPFALFIPKNHVHGGKYVSGYFIVAKK